METSDCDTVLSSEDSLGMEGVKHRGWAGALGLADPADFKSGEAAVLA